MLSDEVVRAVRRGRVVGLVRSAAYRRRQRRVGVIRMGSRRGVRTFVNRRLLDYLRASMAAMERMWRWTRGVVSAVRVEWDDFWARRRRARPSVDGEERVHGRPPDG